MVVDKSPSHCEDAAQRRLSAPSPQAHLTLARLRGSFTLSSLLHLQKIGSLLLKRSLHPQHQEARAHPRISSLGMSETLKTQVGAQVASESNFTSSKMQADHAIRSD